MFHEQRTLEHQLTSAGNGLQKKKNALSFRSTRLVVVDAYIPWKQLFRNALELSHIQDNNQIQLQL